MNNERRGWAVDDEYGININTVSSTRRAAIVNWLVTTKGIMILSTTSDYEIERSWERNKGINDEVVPVIVRRAE